MAFAPCNIESTYVESNLRIFDMTWAAKIDSTVKSILAAPDPLRADPVWCHRHRRHLAREHRARATGALPTTLEREFSPKLPQLRRPPRPRRGIPRRKTTRGRGR